MSLKITTAQASENIKSKHLGTQALHHIFYIHSNITLLAALATTHYLEIKRATFIFGRGFKNNFVQVPYQVINLPAIIERLATIPTYGKSFLMIRYFFSLRETDKLLKSIGKDNFSIYLPNTRTYLMQFLITNKGCKSFNIIEEGLVVYGGINELIKKTNKFYCSTFIGRLLRSLKYINHAGRSQFYYKSEVFLDKAFLFSNSKLNLEINNVNIVQLDWPLLNLTLPELSNKSIFVFDNTVGEKITDLETNIKIVNRIIEKLNKERLLIKFHPAQQDKFEIIQSLNKSKIQYEVISEAVPLELVFLQSKNIKVYGIFSSLLFYAASAGHMSYSFIHLAAEEDPKISLWADQYMPQDFFNTVNLI